MTRGRRGEGSDPLPPSPIRVAAAIVGRCRCPVTVRRDRRIGAVDDRRRVVHDDRRRVIDNGWRVVGGCSVIRACSVVRTRGGVNVARRTAIIGAIAAIVMRACSSRRASPRSAHRMLWGPVPLVRRQPGSERSPQPTAQHPRGSRQATIYAYAPPSSAGDQNISGLPVLPCRRRDLLRMLRASTRRLGSRRVELILPSRSLAPRRRPRRCAPIP